MITLEDVTVRYGATVALHRISERVGDGEWVGLIGPNGAGKTTLLRALVQLLPHDGRTLIDGASTDDLSRRQLARMIAYVPQSPELPPDMMVSDYVLLGRSPHIGYFGVEKPYDRRICADLLERLDLGPMADRHLATLSGGELQRLVLARALAQEAPVLLLDEPTSALDLGRRVDALEIIDALRAEHKLTVLSAMHDLTLAGQFADRLVLLSGGEVVASGTPPEVLDEVLLTEHFGLHVQVMRTPDGELIVAPRRHK
ncbi:MAG TPA: ABC transporter ATP-binding protein [Acidimicrobiales bacterium]|nr:ABC transporter ATP-binding protein [Acidimicrobiales bacterium]